MADSLPTDLVTRLNQMAAAGYAGWETAKEAAERLAWTENYVKACDNEVKRANQRRMETALELDAALMRLQGITALLSEAVDDIESWGGYASSYFRERHDLKGCIARYRAALDVTQNPTEKS